MRSNRLVAICVSVVIWSISACSSILPTPTLTLTPPPTMTPSPTPAPTPTLDAPRLLTGVNLAGADFAPLDHRPGNFGVDYFYPTHAEVDYFVGMGMNIFRLPFNWENLQPAAMGALQADELARLDDLVRYATSAGARVILDPHNYARYYNKVVGTDVPAAALADLWGKLAAHYKDNPRVIFGLMNEPNTMTTEAWRDAANAAIVAIRATGATNLILVPGNAYTSALNWSANFYGTPNSTAMLTITDSGGNYAFEAHQYLDTDGSGNSGSIANNDVNIGVTRISAFTTWCRNNGRKGFLGEFAVANTNIATTPLIGGKTLTNMLNYMAANTDVWIGWTWWSAGHHWQSDYIFLLDPAGGVDKTAMSVLTNYFPATVSPPGPPR